MPDITKVSHGLTIGDLKYGNARPGVVEANLKPGETMEQALDELDDRLNAWHRQKYPHLYGQELTGSDLPPHLKTEITFGPLPVISKDTERLEIEIDNAETVDRLMQVKKDNPVMPFPVLRHYNKRMDELINREQRNTNP